MFPSFALAPNVRVTISTLRPIFHCHKIKDGGYNNITNTHKVSPTQNTPGLQATKNQEMKTGNSVIAMVINSGLTGCLPDITL